MTDEHRPAQTETQTAEQTAETAAEKKPYKMAVPLGIVVLCLALVGVVSLVVMGYYTIRSLQDDSAQKEQIVKDVAMVVSLDPVPFAQVEDANTDFVLTAVIWQTINNRRTSGTPYATTEDGNVVIPKSDLEVTFNQMFGPDHSLPMPDEESTSQIRFDAEKNSYLMPVSAYVTTIRPGIADGEKITEKDGVYTVLIGYSSTEAISVGEASSTAETSSGETTEASKATVTEDGVYKSMLFRLGKNSTGYYVISIEEAPAVTS